MTDSRNKPGPVSTAALGLLWLYKRTLSPLFYVLGARCRHQPTCSDYAAEAFRRHGAWRGFWLAFSRFSRCHPFGSHGFDPVLKSLPDHGWRFWRYGDWAWTERGAQTSERADSPRD
ncbi:MAG: membrane protein insertion efficiency factor YidD [Parvularculaceae bacterium]